MAASPPPLSDPNPNRTVVTVHRHLINDFEPATKQLADAAINLYRALHSVSTAAKEYTQALQGVALTSQRGQPASREFGASIAEMGPTFDRMIEQHDETNGDTLARFYQENQIDALEQERRRYQFIAEKHREWLASYGLMFQTLAPIVNKEASPSKAVETPQQASNNQAAPPTTFTPPDVDSSISLSRSTSQSSTEAPPFSNDVRENDGNIAFVSMTRRDSTPVQTPVLKQHNGNHEDADEADYAQLVKSKKATPPPTPTEQPVQANVMPVQHDIVMLPAPTPAPIPAPPSPPPPPSNEKVLYVVHDFAATSDNQLSIYAGDRIRVQKSGTQGWAFGVNLTNNKSGWFPQGFAQEAFTVR